MILRQAPQDAANELLTLLEFLSVYLFIYSFIYLFIYLSDAVVRRTDLEVAIRLCAVSEISPYLLLGAQDQRLGAEQDQIPCESTGFSSGSCQETKTFMIRACHTPRQPLQNHPSRHLGGWATPWSPEEILDGQHQRVDIPAHARTARKGLLQRRPGRGSPLNRLPSPPDDPIGQGN